MRSSFLATALIQAVTMVSGILSARLLLPEGRGELAAVILWPSLLVSLGNLGIVEAATYLTATRPSDLPRIWGTALGTAALLSVILVIIGALFLPRVLGHYGVDVLRAGRAYLLFIPLSLFTLALMGFLLGRLEFVEYNALRVAGHAMSTVGIAVLAAIGEVSVYSFALAFLLSALVNALAAAALVLRRSPRRWSADGPTLRRLLGFGLRAHAGTIASALNLRLDQMLMALFLPPASLGFYAVAVTLSAATGLASNTVGMVAFPSIANAGSEAGRRQAIGRYARLGLLLSVTSATLVFWLAPIILSIFFGAAFVPAVGTARVLIVAGIPLASSAILTAGLKAMNRPQVASYGEIISLMVTGIALALLLPRFRELGAAWSSLLAYSTAMFFLVWRFTREADISPAELFVPEREDWTYLSVRWTVVSNRWLKLVK